MPPWETGSLVPAARARVGKDTSFMSCVWSETMTFNEYWEDDRFQRKKPNLRGSLKQAFGDNIYFQDREGNWQQMDSHHSCEDGTPNQHNIANDTKADRVLLSTEYTYWGGSGPEIPQDFCDHDGLENIRAWRGYKCNFQEALVCDFLAWFRSLGENGYLGTPLGWPETP